jgi:Transmembrane secretion effector
VMVFDVEQENRRRFLDLMKEMRLIYLRNGAFSWRLDEDLEKPNRFRMEMMVSSWSEHLEQHKRMTRNELAVWRRTWSLHTSASDGPLVKHYLSVHRELMTRRSNSTTAETEEDEESLPGSQMRMQF